MGTIITKLWREDKEIERSFHGEPERTITSSREFSGGRMPTPDEFADLVRNLNVELDRFRLELHWNHITLETVSERVGKLEEETRMNRNTDIQTLRRRSRERALKLRSRLDLKEDPMKVDGFARIKGLLRQYAEADEDSVEFLRKSREDE